MKPRFLLGSGYYHQHPLSDVFIETWVSNFNQHTELYPERAFFISVGDSWQHIQSRAAARLKCYYEVLDLVGNLGHVHQLIDKQAPAKPHVYCGWSASVMALALIAYNNESDFIYREQDCLCFGDYVGEMYRQLGTGNMIFGSYLQDGRHCMPCAQSLFLIRHAFIPKFISLYLGQPDDRSVQSLPEQKFRNMERHEGVKRFTMGVDRGRPLPYDAPVWYAQKFTEAELQELKRRGLL